MTSRAPVRPRTHLLSLLFLCMALESPSPVPAQTPRWLRAGAIAGALGAAAALDEHLRVADAKEGSRPARALAGLGSHLGEWYPAALGLGGAYLLSPAGSEKRAAVVRIMRAAITATIFARMVKVSVGRRRPGDGVDADRFRPMDFDAGWNSFPSGHTTLVFAIAQALDDEIDNRWVETGMYGAGTLVAWARVRQDRHWLSDVVAGAVSGVLVTRALRDGRLSVLQPRLSLGLSGATMHLPVRF